MGVTSPPFPPLRNLPVPQIEQAAIRAVAYADVFDYPLDAREVQRYLHGIAATLEATETALTGCSGPGGPLSHRKGFYMLAGRENMVAVRHLRAAIAARLWPAALAYARVIAGLPFVRMVAVTGSLAWHNVEDEGDIDYLIVTGPGRLWVCRWLIAALRRAAALDGVRICPNYLITTQALSFADRSLYTAYEVARMTPIAGLGMYRRLRRANPWVEAYLPNAVNLPRAPERTALPHPHRLTTGLARLARLTQPMLEAPPAALLERCEMKYRIRKLRLANAATGEASYGVDWCKTHAISHGRRILAAFGERVRALEAGAP